MVIASWMLLGSLTMVVSPTTASAQSTGLEVTNSAPVGTLAAGESVEYTFTVTNTSAKEVSSIVVSDSLESDVTCETDTLAAGASMTCTGSYTITDKDVEAGQIVNTAEATGSTGACESESLQAVPKDREAYTFDNGAQGWSWAVEYSDTSGTPVASLHTRVKSDGESAELAAGLEGTTFTFQYGDSSTDAGPKPIELELVVADSGRLDAGTVVLNGRGSMNIATFTGDNNAAGFQVSTGGNASGPVLITEDEPSEVSADESGVDTTPDVGETLSAGTQYFLGDPQISVTEAPAFALEYSYSDMAAGETATFGFDKLGANLDIENNEWLAPLSGCAEAEKLSASDTETTSLGTPTLDVVKNQPTGKFEVGETLTYTIDVTNSGTVAIDDLVLSDELTDDADESCPETKLDPDASMTCTATYTVTQADVDAGQLDNTATVTGKAPDGSTVEGKGEVSTLMASIPQASMIVKKVGTIVDPDGDRQYRAGDTINYAITATNTGDVDLVDISIEDPLTDDEACPAKTLKAGTAMTCTASHVITQTEANAGLVRNKATVTGTDPAGKKITAWGATSNALTNNSGITVEKGQPEGERRVGSTLTYPITVTNTGSQMVSNLKVSDSLVGNVSCDYTALNPGAKANCTAKYVVTAQDGTAGKVVNTVTAVATDAQGVELAGADFVTTAIARPSLTPTPSPQVTPTPSPQVTPAATRTPTASPAVATPTPSSNVGLAVTGSRALPPTLAAVGMIIVGLFLVGMSRRRRGTGV